MPTRRVGAKGVDPWVGLTVTWGREVCWSPFQCCDVLKGRKVYLSSHFQRFPSVVAWMHHFGPLAR